MRVLHLLTGTTVGGAEMQVLALARALRARGHDVLIVSMIPLGPVAVEAASEGIATASLDMPRGVPDPRGPVRLLRLLRSWRPDVLHSHMAHANVLARLVRPLAAVPASISTIHTADVGGRLRRLSYRLTDRCTDLTTAITQVAADRHVVAGAVPPGRVRVVPNGVDITRFRDLPGARDALRSALGLGEQFVWLAVGRFEPAKDYPALLDGFARLPRGVDGAVLLIAGDGPGRADAERQAHDLGVADRVRFLGVRRDVPALMHAADAYVMSSAWEGLPLVLLEASAAGLPIVSTAVGGTPDVVQAERTGLLVAPRDAAALAGAMTRMMALAPSARRQMGTLGRAHVRESFSLDRVVDLWERIYGELLAGSSARCPPPGAMEQRNV